MNELSTETLLNILTYLPICDQTSLIQTSQALHQKLAPELRKVLYSSWEYDGHIHSFKSLHCFLRTIVEQPALAARVTTLSLGNWSHWSGECPRLEDYIDGQDADDEEYEGSDGGKPVEDDHGSEKLQFSVQSSEISDEDYEKDFHIVMRAADVIGYDEESLKNFAGHVKSRNEDVIIALLAAQLHNLTTMMLVMPENSEGLQYLIEGLVGEYTTVLSKLETVYIFSALHVGPKLHREYHLDFHHILPFLHLPSIRTLKAMTPSTIEWSLEDLLATLPPPSSSNLTSLSLEDIEFYPSSISHLLSIPKTLKSLRWSGVGLLYSSLKQGLAYHTSTLVSLDIHLKKNSIFWQDVGYDAGHEFNDGRILDGATILHIGSFRDFTALRTLRIDINYLCGAPGSPAQLHRLVDLLPETLEELELRIVIKHVVPDWFEQVLELASSGSSLRSLELVGANFEWAPEAQQLDRWRLVEVCEDRGIELKTMRGVTSQSEVPFFRNIIQSRQWGQWGRGSSRGSPRLGGGRLEFLTE